MFRHKLVNYAYNHRKVLLGACVLVLLALCLFVKRDIRPPLPPPYICQPNQTTISSSLEENMAIVRGYPFKHLEQYQQELGLNDVILPVTRAHPVIATACSANHFPESLQMLQNIRDKLFDSYDDINIQYYDMGLKEHQLKKLKTFPRVHVKSFPFDRFPEHVRQLKGYAWKPIIMQLVLKEFGFVMWMDASVRLIYHNIEAMTQIARDNGVAFRHGNISLIAHTDIDTFKIFNENPCNFKEYKEIEANLILLYRTQFINDFVMKPVVSCALSYGCLVTRNSAAIRRCVYDVNNIPDHGCHRFDQAVFAIVFRRLFQNNPKYWIPDEDISGVYICRGPEKYVRILPDFINSKIGDIKLYFDEKNHARCIMGSKWYRDDT